ncbi:MAG: response regulator [Eubacteriales bacterium]|nr:response regulator [Eubacteriales bacterium]
MSTGEKYRLLLADDEMIERMVLVKLLTDRLGGQCEIFQAKNGREALQIHREKHIQIAVLDIEMPGINGIEAAQQIRETDKNCCIIFLTAFDEFSYAKKAITVRALDYLLKPYEEKELLLVLEEAMRIAGERRQWEEHMEAMAKEAKKTEDHERTAEGDGDGSDLRLSRMMEMLMDYIHEHYMEELSMQDAARHLNYSDAYFCKMFKQCFGQNFTSYLTEYRINTAKEMLHVPTVNVKEVGKAVGYADANYFAKVFKRVTGQSPTDYRAEIFQKDTEA